MHLPRKFSRNPYLLALMAVMFSHSLHPSVGLGQVRTKKPDRGVYQPPVLSAPLKKIDISYESDSSEGDRPATELAELVRSRGPATRLEADSSELKPAGTTTRPRRRLVEVPLTDNTAAHELHGIRPVTIIPRRSKLKRVGHQEVTLVAPHHDGVVHRETIIQGSEVWRDEGGEVWTEELGFDHGGTCDGCPDCYSPGCDDSGCDSMGSCHSSWMSRWSNSSMSFSPECWFGSAELMLMFRKGVRLPVLVTTSADTDPDTAGEIGQAGTQVLVGGDSFLKDMTAGGRFSVGTWIDNQQCRSLVMRGWFAGEETFGFHANQNTVPVIARPFLNVSDTQAAAQDTQLVAFPDRATGSVSVNATSDVFGGDLQVRQVWRERFGGTVEMLYGYQYMRMNEDLNISATSTSLDDDFAPIGAILSVADRFDIENEFHGGQFGLATRYREGCWSFHGLAKVGFGSLRRRAKLSGSTFTSIDGANATDPNGLLVRSTNAGTINDDTFGWVPELDISLGWKKYQNFDVTVGYHVIAMTDALQVSGAIDPNLAVNLSDPPTGQQNPSAALRYQTFYLQGIHIGMQYVY